MSIKFESFRGTGGGAVTGGLVYKGTYNATTSSPSLVTATKGDFYIVSVAGALAGITLNVGDHIVFNQDAADPVTSAMFDTIDNTDAVASVNAQTGVVVLNAANVGALAITSNLSDLNNAVTARTNLGLGTAAVKNHGTTNGDLVILDAVGLPAVDGYQLTNLPSSGGLTYQARTTASHSPLTPAADYHYSINADSATFVVNLPALSSLTDGQQIRFKLQARGNAAYDVTINRAGSDTIDGATSQTLSVTYSSITLVVGASEWEIV